jgi:hypothetical protein
VIVALIGALVQVAVGALAQHLEERPSPRDLAMAPTNAASAALDHHAPRLQSTVVVAGLLVATFVFLAAEITAEALGLRDLHHQRLIAAERLRSAPTSASRQAEGGPAGPEDGLLPLSIYLIVGTLISGPYIFYKGAKGWKESEQTQRVAWLSHRRREWLQARRMDADVQTALVHARAWSDWPSSGRNRRAPQGFARPARDSRQRRTE